MRAGGPAARTGLVVGDVIVSIDGYDVRGAKGVRAFHAWLRGEHDRAAVGIGLQRLEGIGDALDHRDVEVVVRRAANLDDRDVALPVHARGRGVAGVVHGCSSLGFAHHT